MARLVIFDADGTLTPQRPTATAPAILELLPGGTAECAKLRGLGVVLAIASNQSPKRSRGEIVRQLRWTAREIGATTIRWATTPARRKPRAAMLLEICRELGIPAENALFVGDQATDEQAAQAVGMGFAWANEFFSRA